MSYIDFDKATEQMIIWHSDDLVALDIQKSRYQELCMSLDGIRATQYDNTGTSGGGADGDTSVIDRIAQKKQAKEKIMKLKAHLKRYDRAWETLSDQEKQVLSAFFQVGYENRQLAVDSLCDTRI